MRQQEDNNIPVAIDAKKLCFHTVKVTNNLNNFPKKYRFTLVDRIVRLSFDIYDAIERVYELNTWELSGVLDVSMGVIGYARTQRTIAKRKKQFSSRLHIPEEFFDKFLSTQLEELKKFK